MQIYKDSLTHGEVVLRFERSVLDRQGGLLVEVSQRFHRRIRGIGGQHDLILADGVYKLMFSGRNISVVDLWVLQQNEHAQRLC